MRCIRFFLLSLLLLLAFGCAAKQQDVRQDVNANVALNAKARQGDFCLIKPADGPVLSAYGMRTHPTKKRKKFHTGVDIAAKRGSAVLAAAPGTVVFSGRRNGYGKTVEIDHGNGRNTLYAHLDAVFVSQGQKLPQGERIGTVGRSGRTTGPNLHFELLANGRHINPVPSQGWADAAPLLFPPAGQSVPLAHTAPAKGTIPSVATGPAQTQAPLTAIAPATSKAPAKKRNIKKKHTSAIQAARKFQKSPPAHAL